MNNKVIHEDVKNVCHEEQKREGRHFLTNYLAVFSGRAVSVFLSAAVLVAATRALGPERFGVLSLFLMTSGFFATIFVNWQNSAILRFGREEYIRENTISRTFAASIFIFATAVVASSLLMVFFRAKLVNYIGVGQIYIFLVLLYVMTSALYDMSSYIVQSVGKMKIYSAFPVIEKIVALSLLLIFGAISPKGLSLTGVILSFIGGHLIVIALSFFIVKDKIVPSLKVEIEYVKKIVGYAWSMAIGAMATFVVNWIDVIVIKKYMRLTDVGVYSLAYRGMGFFLLLIMATIPLTTPIIISLRTLGKNNLIKIYIDSLIPLAVLVWSIFLSGIIFVADFFIPLIFGESYAAASGIFSILLIGMAFNAVGCLYSGFTGAFDIVAPVVAISVVLSIIKTIGDFVIVPVYGMTGAAVVSSVALLIANMLYIPVLAKYGGAMIGSENKMSRYYVFVWTMPAISAIVLSVVFPASYLLRFIGITVFILLTVLLARKWRLFKPETLEIIEKLQMPPFAKKGARSVFRILS